MKKKIILFYEKYMYFVGSIGHSIFIFQAIKILQLGSSQGVSLTGFLVAFFSIFSWLVYGYLKEDKVLLVVNTIGVIAALFCILVILMI